MFIVEFLVILAHYKREDKETMMNLNRMAKFVEKRGSKINPNNRMAKTKRDPPTTVAPLPLRKRQDTSALGGGPCDLLGDCHDRERSSCGNAPPERVRLLTNKG